jgi:hypothetical protein
MYIALTAARLASQSAAAGAQPDVVTADLAAQIVAAVAPAGRVSLEAGTDILLETELTDRLAARGVQVVGAADGVPAVRVRCFDNLRERACSAEFAEGTRNAILVTRRHDLRPPQPPRIGLTLRPVLSHEMPILDIARMDRHLLVLTPDAVTRYEERGGAWQSVQSRAVSSVRPWPRDVRGRLRVSPERVEAFLPGVACSGTAEPLAMTCAEGSPSWPVDIDDARLDPSRNYFQRPDGFAFYGIASLGFDAGARWLAATVDHRLAFFDDPGQAVLTTASGDDVISVAAPCASARYVVASTSDRDGDVLTVFQVVRRRLVPAATPLPLAGTVTALWPAPADGATVITRDRDAGRYVAHELTVSCSR